MTASLQPESKSPSRRALLAGALGGLGALAATAIGRPQIALGHDPEDVRLGGANAASTTTYITNSTTASTALNVQNSATGNGISGGSTSGVGVSGSSGSGSGVFGQSSSDIGVYGYSGATNLPATLGYAFSNSTGVYGFSGTGLLPSARAKTGVYGLANQDGSSKGVVGKSSKGYAGYFIGKVYTTRFHEMREISAPSAPGANKARLFVRDNGSGKTQLCVRFPTGAVQVIKTEL